MPTTRYRVSIRIPAALVPALDIVASGYRPATRHCVAAEAFRRGLLMMAAEKKIALAENTHGSEVGAFFCADPSGVGSGTIA